MGFFVLMIVLNTLIKARQGLEIHWYDQVL